MFFLKLRTIRIENLTIILFEMFKAFFSKTSTCLCVCLSRYTTNWYQNWNQLINDFQSDPNSYIYEIPTEEKSNDDVNQKPSTEPMVQKNPFLETLHRRLDQMMEAEGEVEEKVGF